MEFFAIALLVIAAIQYRRRQDGIQLPLLMTAVVIGWILPQAFGLARVHWLPSGALDKFCVLTIVALLATWRGYNIRFPAPKAPFWTLDFTTLNICAAALVAMGSFFYYLVSEMAPEAVSNFGGRWTGIITIYVFFSGTLTIGLAIAAVSFLHKRALLSGLTILYGAALVLERAIVRGRRAVMVEIVLAVLLFAWFKYRWAPPRWAMISTLVAGAMIVSSVGQYRNLMLDTKTYNWSGAGIAEIFSIDFLGNLAPNTSDKLANQEVLNAALTIEAVDRRLSFDYGLSLWNELVFSYVPAQLVGANLKEALQFELDDAARREFGHVQHTGTTSTGIADAFASFWYLGFLKFLAIGSIAGFWFQRAAKGSISAQIVTMLIAVPGLLALTHGTDRFFSVFIMLGVFLLPALLISRKKPAHVTTRAGRVAHDPNAINTRLTGHQVRRHRRHFVNTARQVR
jgi:hypothetical protein